METAEGLAFLLGVGCDVGQGYHWSRPLPASDLTVWLEGYYGPIVPHQLVSASMSARSVASPERSLGTEFNE